MGCKLLFNAQDSGIGHRVPREPDLPGNAKIEDHVLAACMRSMVVA